MEDEIKLRKQYIRLHIDKDTNEIKHIETNDEPIISGHLTFDKELSDKLIIKDIEFERPFINGGINILNGLKVRVDKGHIGGRELWEWDVNREITGCHLEFKAGAVRLKDSAPMELKAKIRNFKELKE